MNEGEGEYIDTGELDCMERGFLDWHEGKLKKENIHTIDRVESYLELKNNEYHSRNIGG